MSVRLCVVRLRRRRWRQQPIPAARQGLQLRQAHRAVCADQPEAHSGMVHTIRINTRARHYYIVSILCAKIKCYILHFPKN